MMEETKDRFMLSGHEEHFVEEERRAEEGELEEMEARVIFTFILHHELYPFEAPYITASLSVLPHPCRNTGLELTMAVTISTISCGLTAGGHSFPLPISSSSCPPSLTSTNSHI